MSIFKKTFIAFLIVLWSLLPTFVSAAIPADLQEECSNRRDASNASCLRAANESSAEVEANCATEAEALYQNCLQIAESAVDNAPATAAGITSSPATGPALDSRGVPAGYYDQSKKGVPGLLPSCAFNSSGCDGENADINIFVELGINIARFIFAIIGSVAFIMFVYGGFTMILSFGSSEKFKKGQDILVAAVVGMIISFGAYLIVNFVLDVLQVGKDFRAIGG